MRLDFERWADSGCSIGGRVDQPDAGVAEVACVAGGSGRHGPGQSGNQKVSRRIEAERPWLCVQRLKNLQLLW